MNTILPKPPELTGVKNERVVDAVYKVLREGIVKGTFAPGHQLNLEEVANKLGVSRTPVQQALIQLGRDGLVEILPRRGAFVVSFMPDDIREIMDVRRALELLACEMAVARARGADIARLSRLATEIRDSSCKGIQNPGEAARRHDALNLEFHQYLMRLSGNKRAYALYEQLKSNLHVARVRARSAAWKSRVQQEFREHEGIIQALKARDLKRLHVLIYEHVKWAKEALVADMLHKETLLGGTQ